MGPYGDRKPVPAFLSGSAHYGTFLVGRFTGGKLYVWVLVVDHFDDAKLYIERDGHRYAAGAASHVRRLLELHPLLPGRLRPALSDIGDGH